MPPEWVGMMKAQCAFAYVFCDPQVLRKFRNFVHTELTAVAIAFCKIMEERPWRFAFFAVTEGEASRPMVLLPTLTELMPTSSNIISSKWRGERQPLVMFQVVLPDSLSRTFSYIPLQNPLLSCTRKKRYAFALRKWL